ncbi:ABC transporter permease [Candidatus Woesebacteria bacterium]|jgi:ABC-type polysaccharide/polyol phosphate export permease|nr:ABC transporter permease [Candidatus Woesebacteria bacterium]HPK08530.1 ABC transporter permease [Candidatus Woesebacteria bacterium]
MKKIIKLSKKQRYWLDFVSAMTQKEIKARYKRATFGFLWLVLNPLLQMLVMGFVFQFFVPVRVDNYFLFLFAGLLPWNFFAQSLTKTTPAFFYERNLIKKAKFPREGIILSIIFSNLFHFLIALILLMIALIGDKLLIESYTFMQLINYALRMLWVFPAILLLLLFTIGLSLITSSLNVKFRDINFIVSLAVMLWFYATPVIYALNLLPEFIQPLFYLNPMTTVVEMFHYALMGLPMTMMNFVWVAIVLIIAIFYFGIKIFNKESKNFDDWL